MKRRLLAWLRLFRVVNMPTVPGDVFAGAACALLAAGSRPSLSAGTVLVSVAGAAAASVALYAYGLVDNDIIGAATDKGRPIPDGEIAMPYARIARSLCWLAVLLIGVFARLPVEWWYATLALFVAVALYNRSKSFLLMGLCRGLNVLCGAAALSPRVVRYGRTRWDGLLDRGTFAALAVASVWVFYIAAVTWYSKGEEENAAKRARVGFLVGAIVYLQLAALIVLVYAGSPCRWLLVAGAVMLVFLRLAKRMLPQVSAS